MTQGTKKQCSIDGCERTNNIRRGWCNAHYLQWRKYGDPLKRSRFDNPEESFAARTEWQGDCLVWTGTRNASGHGRIRVDGKMPMAHRYAWEREHGPIPDGVFIDHICQNPPCVNVEHLRLATIQENNFHRDGPTKGNKYSGLRNVYPKNSGWMVRLKKYGKPHYFGTFNTIEEAAKVAEQARKQLFGEFAGKG